MICRTYTTAAAAALLLAGLAQAGTVEVGFVQPERYTDAGPDAEATRKTLDQHLQALGQVGLPAQQRLKIEILDIDLAGEIRPMLNLASDLRVIKGRADWPRIHLRYVLSDAAQTLGSGDETVSDMAYLMRSPVNARSESLPYERRMLSDWFRSRFGPAAAKP
jgi:hypothetical protein